MLSQAQKGAPSSPSPQRQEAPGHRNFRPKGRHTHSHTCVLSCWPPEAAPHILHHSSVPAWGSDAALEPWLHTVLPTVCWGVAQAQALPDRVMDRIMEAGYSLLAEPTAPLHPQNSARGMAIWSPKSTPELHFLKHQFPWGMGSPQPVWGASPQLRNTGTQQLCKTLGSFLSCMAEVLTAVFGTLLCSPRMARCGRVSQDKDPNVDKAPLECLVSSPQAGALRAALARSHRSCLRGCNCTQKLVGSGG